MFRKLSILVALFATPLVWAQAGSLGSAFTYQGHLTRDGAPFHGKADFQIAPFDAEVDGNQVGPVQSLTSVTVKDGLFTLSLDSGAAIFNGDERWLAIRVRAPSGIGSYVDLSPRQPLRPTPYALHAATAESVPGGLTGSGAAGRIAKFTGSQTLDDSLIFEVADKVGFGTTSPEVKTQIVGGTDVNVTTGGYLALGQLSGFNLCLDNNEIMARYNGAAAGLYLNMDGGDVIVSSNGTGRVGIQTSTPDTELDVNGTVKATGVQLTGGAHNGYVLISDAAGNGTWEPRATDTCFWNASGTNDVYYSAGYVGIGASGPNWPLDVGHRVELNVEESAGVAWTHGSNGSYNAGLTYIIDYPNNGAVAVRDAAGNTRARLYVDSLNRGVVEGNIKNFRMANPRVPETDIVYACIEGPEAAAYCRGTDRLVAGRAVVRLPEHFQDVGTLDGMTVQVTPRSAESKGLAVTEQALDHFVVQELFEGTGQYEFHWRVEAVRKGYENYEVIRPSSQDREAQP